MRSACIALLSVAALATAQSQPWGQCGGVSWAGPTTCTSGWSCVSYNPYYSQCLQGTATTAQPAATTCGSPSSAQSQPWGQCGGQSWTGPTACTSGWTCVYSNPYYSQCLQATSTSTSTSSTQSSTTTQPPSTITSASSSSTTTTTSSTSTSSSAGSTSTVNSLNQLAQSQGKLYFGSATDNPELTDVPYTAILFSNMFGQITPGNAMKWGPTEPQQGTYTYGQGDQIVSLAKAAGQIVRGHNLIWNNQLPGWLNTGFTNASLIQALTDHITSEVTHYAGQVYCWDVINEPFDDGGGMRSWLYQDIVGTEYLAIALTAAHAADPNAKLYINDYNLEYTGAKFDTAVSTITALVQAGVPIHGVGFEGHMIVGDVPSASAIAAQMNVFTALGLEVAFTEIDIRMTLPATPALIAQQKADYQSMVTACMMVEKCVGITVWDYTDRYSWIPGVFTGQGYALPWDTNLLRKPAYDGIVAGLMSSAAHTSTTTQPPSTTTSASSSSSTTTTTSTSTSSSAGSTSTVNSLNQLAQSQGKKYFGSATDNPELTDAPYTAILFSNMFGQITPGNAMKWGPTEPSQGTYTYTQGDQIVSLAKAAGQIVRGHNLIWNNQLPGWLNTGFTNASLIQALTDHITSEVTHFAGQVYCWDVINEPFDDGGGMRSWLYQDIVGTEYLAIALTAAHAADPNAKLYINDYNLEYTGAKFDTAVSTITALVQAGVPIHGVGFEGHMIVGDVPSASAIAAQMNVFTALGLEVAFTEIDIRMTLPATPALIAQQKADYQSMVTACMMVEKCVGITVWDYTDRYSWIPGVFTGQGYALPWDTNLLRKPAYDGVVAGLMS